MATICPLCGATVADGEVCTCSEQLGKLAEAAMAYTQEPQMATSAPLPENGGVMQEEFSVAPLQRNETAPQEEVAPFERFGEAPAQINYEEPIQKPEENQPFERLGEAVPDIEEIPPTEIMESYGATEIIAPMADNIMTTEGIEPLQPVMDNALMPGGEPMAPMADNIMTTEGIEPLQPAMYNALMPGAEPVIPMADNIMTTEGIEPLQPVMDNALMPGAEPVAPMADNIMTTEGIEPLQQTMDNVLMPGAEPVTEIEEYAPTTDDVSILRPNVTEPPAPTLIYDTGEQQPPQNVVYDAAANMAQQQINYDQGMTASDVEDYTVQTQLGDPVITRSVFADAGTSVEASTGEQTISYTERYKEQDRLIRQMAGLPPEEEEPEPQPEPQHIWDENKPQAEENVDPRYRPCATDNKTLFADAKREPVTTAMRYVGSGKTDLSNVILGVHAVIFGLFVAVFSMRLFNVYGYSLSFERFNTGKFITGVFLGIVLSVGVHAAMAGAMNYISSEYSRMADFWNFIKAVSLHALVMIPFNLLSLVLALVNPMFAIPLLFVGYGMGSYLMGHSLEGIQDVDRDQIMTYVMIGNLVHGIGIILLLIMIGVVIF